MSTWRDGARPIIAKVLKENEGKDEKVILAALKAAYPYGERAMHPNKVWLDEIKIQRGKRKFGKKKKKHNPKQKDLF